MTNQSRVNDQGFQSNSIILNTRDTKEIAKFTEDGFYYKGEFVDDAGEVHRLFKEMMYEMRLPLSQQQEIVDCKLVASDLLDMLDFYSHQCNTDISTEKYQEALILEARARAVLSRYPLVEERTND